MFESQIVVFLLTLITFLKFSDHVSAFIPIINKDIFKVPQSVFNDITTAMDEKEYLDAHNTFRAARGMPRLQWDDRLKEYAKYWGLARSKDCNYTHHSHGPYAENIMWEQYDGMTPTDVVKMWGDDEEVNYDRSRRRCKCIPETPTCKCSHYLAMVWKTTKRLGCATTTCKKEKGLFIVCEYEPKGIWKGEDPLNPIH